MSSKSPRVVKELQCFSRAFEHLVLPRLLQRDHSSSVLVEAKREGVILVLVSGCMHWMMKEGLYHSSVTSQPPRLTPRMTCAYVVLDTASNVSKADVRMPQERVANRDCQLKFVKWRRDN